MVIEINMNKKNVWNKRKKKPREKSCTTILWLVIFTKKLCWPNLDYLITRRANVTLIRVVCIICILFPSDVEKNTRNEDEFCMFVLMINECKLVKNGDVNMA